MCIDTAADINLMSTTVYTQIFEDPVMEFLGPMDIALSAYNDTAIHTLGTCVILLVSPIDSHRHDTKFYVAQHSGTTTHIPMANGQVPHNPKEVKKKFSDVFNGLGKFPGKPYHINLNPVIPPKQVPCRPVPIHQQEEFKRQLTKMKQAGDLMPVTQSTPWISSYVNVESEDNKGGKKFHICLDLTNLNKAILCEPYSPTLQMMFTSSCQRPKC